MSKDTDTSPTLAVSARRQIATAFCNALDAQSNTGSIVTQVCDVARSIMKGKPFPVADMASIVEEIADKRGWEGPTAKVRGSEVRTVLSSYAKLPEAIKLAQRDGTCNWHFAMKLARELRKGAKPADAVATARDAASSKAQVPLEGRIASLLKKLAQAKPRKRDAIMKAAHLIGVEL